ncbi:MAG: hypothetical protein RIT43_1974 [Bacteroidota bacterium]|jgi:hypothetical protein
MLQRRIFFVVLLISGILRSAPDSIPVDSVKARKIVAGTGIGLAWAGSMGTLWGVWYSKEELSRFHFFNDGNFWLQMDKAGHFYTSYQISRLTNDIFTWSGIKPSRAAWIASGISVGYQTTLELFDGLSKNWGFSIHDFGYNVLGTSLFTTQELLLGEQWILPKFSYFQSPYAKLRPEILGTSFGERLLKDYNGQTYWLSLHPFLPSRESSFPKWICFSIGYSADAKLKGDMDTYTHTDGTVYSAHREWLFSMDLDFSRIPVKKPFWKKVLKQFNWLKLPFPALKLSNGKLTAVPIYF